MTTTTFWKYANSIDKEEKLFNVFSKFASELKISPFEKEYLWKAINKDVETFFKKTAADDTNKIIKTTIQTLMDSLIDGGVIETNINNEDAVTDITEEEKPVTKEEESSDKESDSKVEEESKKEVPEDVHTVFDRMRS